MNNIFQIIQFTIREALARKVFIFFGAIILFVLVGTLLVFGLVDINTLTSAANQSGQNIMTREIVSSLELLIVTPLANLGLLLAIFSSASFIPIMLEKGNIDLLLSKPISRAQLLLGKYFGVVLFVFLNIFFFVFGVWLIISIKFSYWDASFLTLAFVITFAFAVLYALIMLFGVITKNSILGMMIAYLIFLIISPLLLLYKEKLNEFVTSELIDTILVGFYFIVPQTAELMGRIMIDLAMGKGIINFQPIITSLLFLIFILGFSVSLFRRKDF
ncbi:MAG: ABC transporter permease [Bacteroidetes bacterium]|nr:ABC transporter permease [Bacteroidota bacterium]